ncbi:MAG: histidine kinase [Flavobacteriales bacterium]|nr:histidine kinase [Flavobacteriales bacterium]
MRALILICALVLPALLRGQDGGRPLRFLSLTERDGLPFRNARCLHVDDRGALWIGTRQGLAVYDGGVLVPVPLDTVRTQPDIAEIVHDSTGTLWLGTTRGLYRLDPRTRLWKHWKLPWVTKRNGFVDAVSSLCITADDQLYGGGEGGLFRFDPAHERFDSLSVNGRRIATASGIIRTDSAGTGFWAMSVEHKLMYFSTRDGLFRHQGHNPGAHPLLTGLSEECMVVDGQGNIWLARNPDPGLRCYSPGDGRMRAWSHLPGHPGIAVMSWPGMRTDAAGRIWMMGTDFYPMRFDPMDSSVVRVANAPDDPGTIASNFISDVAMDREGRTWFATNSGVSVLVEEGFTYAVHHMGRLVDDRTDVYVAAIEGTADGTLWMATELGLLSYDPRANAKRRDLLDPSEARSNAILDLCERGGVLWLATRNGIWSFDPHTRRARHFTGLPPDAGSMRGVVYAWITKDRQGMIWAGTWGRGLVRIDPATNACTWFAPDDADPKAPLSGQLLCATSTRDGDLWIGHGGKGLMRYVTSTGRFERVPVHGMPNDSAHTIVLAIQEDPSGRLWLGVRDVGLVRFEPATGRTEVFGYEHGLRGLVIQAMRIDKRGRPWVGTTNELACFDPEQKRFVAMPVAPGGAFSDFEAGCAALKDGDLVFSSVNTLVRFDPLSFDAPAPPPAPALREAHVYNHRLPWLPGDSLVLGHEQDQVDLRFGAPSLPRAIVAYSYFLDGVSREWVTTATGVARFDHVAPGEYTLRMKARDRWGNWSPEGALRFSVVPPWWRTLWARGLFALAIAGLIVVSFRLRLNWIRRRERKEEAMARSMNELRLQALSAQMDPHFVFNSLNSIDRFILMQRSEEASRYLNRFAKLIRLILHRTDQLTVPLKKEVEMLGYYMELESLRFETPFSFELKTDPRLLDRDVRLPPMLVQPFVENAIWHGLQHKQGPGRLQLDFRLHGEDLLITVEDDGVGREASARINAQRRSDHQSKATELTENRLELLRRNAGLHSRVEIIDLRDAAGEASGTRVAITLSLDEG